MRDAWAAGMFDEERTLSLHPASPPTPTPGLPPPAPAAMPPVAAGATSNASARPRVDPHGNGVRIGEADTPAPSAGDGDANAPAPPSASAHPLDPNPGAAFCAPHRARLRQRDAGRTPSPGRILPRLATGHGTRTGAITCPSTDACGRASTGGSRPGARSGASARRMGQRRMAAGPASTAGIRRAQPERIAANSARRRHAAEQRRMGTERRKLATSQHGA